MNRTVLQVPIDVTVKDKAQKAAELQGFSSLQEVVRVFLNKLSTNSLEVGFYDVGIKLSTKAEKRYEKMLKGLKENKNVSKFSSTEDLLSVLD